jgi:hypothetical protein
VPCSRRMGTRRDNASAIITAQSMQRTRVWPEWRALDGCTCRRGVLSTCMRCADEERPFTQGRDGYVLLANEYAVEASLSIEECTR